MPAGATYFCTAEGWDPLKPFPPMWFSSLDSSDPANGVHCVRVDAPYQSAAARALRLLLKMPLP